MAYTLSWTLGSLRAERDSRRSCKAESLPAFIQLPFIFSSCLKSCYLHRAALRGPKEMCKKLLVFVFPMPLWRRAACHRALTPAATNIMKSPLVETLLSGFMQRKGIEIVNFQNSSIDLQGSRIESNLVICGSRQREVSPHSLCVQEKCIRMSSPLVNSCQQCYWRNVSFIQTDAALRQVCKYLSYPHCKLRKRYLLLKKVIKNS